MRGSGGGPKTATGRAAVRRNAVKHGILSPHPVIIEGIETVAGWERFLDGIVESLAPEGNLEHELAERIAYLLWRLRRHRHAETAEINYQVHGTASDLYLAEAYLDGRDVETPDPDPRKVEAYQQLRIIPDSSSIDRLTRYETHLHRLWVQTLHELEALQARRRGQPAYLARVDFSGPPTS